MKKAFLYSFFLLCGLNLYAQTHVIDSLRHVVATQKEDTNKVNTLNTLSKRLKEVSKYNAAIQIALQAESLAENLNFEKGISDACNGIGIIYTIQGNYPEALEEQMQALKTAQAIGDKNNISHAYLDIGVIYTSEGNYSEGMKNYLESLKIAKQTGNQDMMSADYTNIGLIYKMQGNYTEALNDYMKSLEIDKQLNDIFNQNLVYGNIGDVYEKQGNYSEAMNYQLKALKISKQAGDKESMVTDYVDIGNVYLAWHNYSEALKKYLQALNMARQIGDKEDMSHAYAGVSRAYTRARKYKLARQYLDSTLTLSKKTKQRDLVRDAYKSYVILDRGTDNYRAAFADYKNYIAYSDSLINDKQTKKITQEQMQYKFDTQQAAEQAAQDKKDAMSAADKKRQRVVTASVSIGLLLVLIFAGILLNRFKLTQRQKKIIEDQKAVVEEKNKNIIDSITYAKRLQDAILPHENELKKLLPQSFVIYKPKDIVAGDFYWLEKTGNTILVAAADCTGHGVPGAMVSVVCSNALNQAVKEFNLIEPGKILDKTRELVLATFAKSGGEIKDGMDISLCAITPLIAGEGAGVRLQWAGAYNPLWYAQDNEIKEVEADKQPIGETDNAKPFTTHTINLNQGDTLYLFTDGYADQFGGEKGKKFKYRQLSEKIKGISNKPMEEQKRMLEEEFEKWKGLQEQTDDVCVVGIKV